ncbi:hypothetical protein ABIE78_003959 [Sinorhizobium fredii]
MNAAAFSSKDGWFLESRRGAPAKCVGSNHRLASLACRRMAGALGPAGVVLTAAIQDVVYK